MEKSLLKWCFLMVVLTALALPALAQKQKKNQKRFIINNVPNLGKVKGRIFKSRWTSTDIYQFLDIRYGESPSGMMRFKPSEPAKRWTGVRNAFTTRKECPSLQDMISIRKQELYKQNPENCLTLSISSKNISGTSPVMVYIHGDFLYEGSSNEAMPGYLLEDDIVLVSVRYRLGPFGFLSTGTDTIPGNAAVTDVILALEWIQKHIESFGGDPSRVTLFGQVGGAALINVLTMSPKVRDGLFHRVIYQSGSSLTPAFITEEPLAAAKDIAKRAGCKNVNRINELDNCLMSMNVTTLLKSFSEHAIHNTVNGIGSYGGIQIVVGGPSGILPEHPGKLIGAKKIKYYPTIGGSVKNAGTFLLKDIYIDSFNETIPDDQYDPMGYIKHIISQTNGADPSNAWTNFAKEEYFSKQDIENGTFYDLVSGLIDMCGTISFKNPILLALQANAKVLPNDTYLYSFDYSGEYNRYQYGDDELGDLPFDLGVSLTDENLYLFPWPKYAILTNNRDIKIAKRMVALWTSFAATGIPQAPGVENWPPMTEETGPYLKLDRIVSIGDNYLDEYAITVQEAAKGFSLVNEEFFDNLEEVELVRIGNTNSVDNKDQANKPRPIVEASQMESEDNEDDDEDTNADEKQEIEMDIDIENSEEEE